MAQPLNAQQQDVAGPAGRSIAVGPPHVAEERAFLRLRLLALQASHGMSDRIDEK